MPDHLIQSFLNRRVVHFRNTESQQKTIIGPFRRPRHTQKIAEKQAGQGVTYSFGGQNNAL